MGTALDVLECFALDGELGVSDIARRLDIAKSTAHRLLTTLASRGFVEQNPHSGRYQLGIHLYELGHLAQARFDLRQVALPTMMELSRSVGCVINLSVPDGADVVYIERLEVGAGSKLIAGMGRRLAAPMTSSGKAIAAFNPDLDRACRDRGFPIRDAVPLRTEQDWDEALEAVRRRGFAMTSNEAFANHTSIAVPLLDVGQQSFAALSVLGPTDHMLSQIPHLERVLRASALKISKALGSPVP